MIVPKAIDNYQNALIVPKFFVSKEGEEEEDISCFKVKRKAKCTYQWPMRSRRAYTSILRVKISHKLITCKSNFDRTKILFLGGRHILHITGVTWVAMQ